MPQTACTGILVLSVLLACLSSNASGVGLTGLRQIHFGSSLFLRGGKQDIEVEGPGLNIADLRNRALEKCVEDGLISAPEYIDTADPEGWRPIHLAVKAERPDHVLLLGQAGADLNSLTVRGVTGLLIASFAGNEVMVRALLKAGADPNFREDKEGRTALLMAAAGGHRRVMEVLLEGGAEVDLLDKEQRSALWAAAHFGHKDIVAKLLEAGADAEKSGVSQTVCAGVVDPEDPRAKHATAIKELLAAKPAAT